MIKGFPIEFIQKAITQVLLEEHNKDNKYFGGDNQISITSFYEQLKTQEEVDRFTDVFRDLTNQQNKTQLIGNGIITLPDNPTYTNLYSAMIIPMTWACSIRLQIKNRDQMIYTINNLTDKLKGSKVDIAELDVIDTFNRHIGVPFVVGTIGHNYNSPILRNGDYIDDIINPLIDIEPLIDNYISLGIAIDTLPLYVYAKKTNGTLGVLKIEKYTAEDYMYFVDDFDSEELIFDGDIAEFTADWSMSIDNTSGIEDGYYAYTDIVLKDGDGNLIEIIEHCQGVVHDIHESEGRKIYSATFTFPKPEGTIIEYFATEIVINERLHGGEWLEDDGGDYPILFPPEHEGFERYKLSLSFDSIKCNQPRTLNGDEYCDISFGGSATLVNENVALGNDLVKVAIKRNKIVAETPITFNDEYTWLEPLEMPSGNNPSTQPLQLLSNKMLSNTQTDSVSVSIQYSFIADMGLELLKNWFKYARYGRINTNNISPNIIYDVVEYWSSWGVVEAETYLGKIADNIEIDNTESDTITIGITMQVQGENN